VRTLLVNFHPSKSPDVIFGSNPESSPGSIPSSSPGSSPGSNPGLINRYPLSPTAVMSSMNMDSIVVYRYDS
jgi:hypothetical protein